MHCRPGSKWAESPTPEPKPPPTGTSPRGWGGYIVLRIRHPPVPNTGDYDLLRHRKLLQRLLRTRNRLGRRMPTATDRTSAKPGTNSKGSEYANAVFGYEATYVEQPDGTVIWTDNYGGKDTIDRVSLHTQSYVPAWGQPLTYAGTRLPDNVLFDQGDGHLRHDLLRLGICRQRLDDRRCGNENRFKISNAVDADGNPANLRQIDFVKIQTGVNCKARKQRGRNLHRGVRRRLLPHRHPNRIVRRCCASPPYSFRCSVPARPRAARLHGPHHRHRTGRDRRRAPDEGDRRAAHRARQRHPARKHLLVAGRRPLSAGSTIFIKSYGRATLATASFRGTAPLPHAGHLERHENELPDARAGRLLAHPLLLRRRRRDLPRRQLRGNHRRRTGRRRHPGEPRSPNPRFSMRYVQGIGSFSTFDEFLRLTYGGDRWSSTRVLVSTSRMISDTATTIRSSSSPTPTGRSSTTTTPLQRNRNGAFMTCTSCRSSTTPRGRATAVVRGLVSRHRPRAGPASSDRNSTREKRNSQTERTLRAVAAWDRLFGEVKTGVRAGILTTTCAT